MYWFNGESIEKNTIELNIYDPGFLYGANIFTTLRVYENSLNHPLTNWQPHCQRLSKSIKKFAWENPNWEIIKQGAEILKSQYEVLRIAIFPDGRELIIGRDLPKNLKQLQGEGITGWLADSRLFKRSLAEDKTGNYLSPWLALQEAKKIGAQEAILMDTNHNWLETSTGNLWGYKDNVWFTPSLGKILPGIFRGFILGSKTTDFVTVENTWNWDFVKGLEAIAYSNSVVEIIPFHSIILSENNLENNLIFDPKHSAFQKLRKLFSK